MHCIGPYNGIVTESMFLYVYSTRSTSLCSWLMVIYMTFRHVECNMHTMYVYTGSESGVVSLQEAFYVFLPSVHLYSTLSTTY